MEAEARIQHPGSGATFPEPVPPPIRRTPPTSPGTLPRPKPVWPQVLGIVAIVFGGGGVLYSIYSAVTMWYTPRLFANVNIPGVSQMHSVFLKWQTPVMVAHGVGLILAIWLLWAGVLLLRRRRRAAPLLLAWGLLRVVHALSLAMLTFLMQRDQMTATFSATSNGPGAPAMPFGAATPMFSNGVATMQAGVLLLWWLLLPIFILVWFCLPRVTAEVRNWASPASRPEPIR